MPNKLTTQPLTKDEAKRLATKIKRGITTVRDAVAQLHDGQGWEALGYATWEKCCKGEFDWSRSYAHRQLEAARVEQRLLPIGNTGRLPESHTRELARLPEDEQAPAYDEAVALHGEDLSAKHVRAIVDGRLEATEGVSDDVLDVPADEVEEGVSCPNCGGNEFDEDGDCVKCLEPAVAASTVVAEYAADLEKRAKEALLGDIKRDVEAWRDSMPGASNALAATVFSECAELYRKLSC